MNKSDFNKLIEEAHTFSHHSFKYIEYDNVKSYRIIEKNDSIIAILGFSTSHHINEIIWATNSIQSLISLIKENHMCIIGFIPKNWKDELILHGCTEYGILRDYWIHDFGHINFEAKLSLLRPEETKIASDITLSCHNESREFHGETEDFMNRWLYGNEASLVQAQAKYSNILTYRQNGTILGVVLVAIYGFDNPNGKVIWIREIAVQKEYQNQGIGRKLIMDALDYGKIHEVKRGFLAADDLNQNAIHLYQSIGFKPNINEEQIDLYII